MDDLLNEKQVANILNCSVHKLRADRQNKIGLKFLKINRAVRYRRDDINAFIESKIVATTTGLKGIGNGKI